MENDEDLFKAGTSPMTLQATVLIPTHDYRPTRVRAIESVLAHARRGGSGAAREINRATVRAVTAGAAVLPEPTSPAHRDATRR